MAKPTKSDPSKPNLNYVCPHCGQPAVAGAHFCDKTTAPKPAKAAQKPRGQTGSLVVLVFVGVGVIGLWRFLGPGALVVAALGLVGLLLWRAGRKK